MRVGSQSHYRVEEFKCIRSANGSRFTYQSANRLPIIGGFGRFEDCEKSWELILPHFSDRLE